MNLAIFDDQYDFSKSDANKWLRILPYQNMLGIKNVMQYLIDASQQLLERFENHPKYNKLAEALIKFQDGEDEENESYYVEAVVVTALNGVKTGLSERPFKYSAYSVPFT